MILDDVFEQKDDIAKAVSQELEKVIIFPWGLIMIYWITLQVDENRKRYPSYLVVTVDFITLYVTLLDLLILVAYYSSLTSRPVHVQFCCKCNTDLHGW